MALENRSLVMTHFEMLQNPNFKLNLEQRIVRHINDEYMRTGFKILAKALDEKEESNA